MSSDKLAGMAAEAEATCFDEWDRGYAAGLRAALAEIERHEAEKQAGPVAWWKPEFEHPIVGRGPQQPMLYPDSMPLYAAPPSPLTEQDKDDAEMWRWVAWNCLSVTTIGADKIAATADAIRAARAKKEQT